MLATGWTAAELAAQPADVVRRLFWRLHAARAWRPELLSLAYGPLPPPQDVAARDARAGAMTAVAALERHLWPEDGDDG